VKKITKTKKRSQSWAVANNLQFSIARLSLSVPCCASLSDAAALRRDASLGR
jgi:hypothetical protein